MTDLTFKELSIKEPYASMINDGKKTIETRTWATDYRGEILICASKSPKGLLSGLAFATARIIDCRLMTREDEKAACCEIYPNAWAWILEDIWSLPDPFPVMGQLSLFKVII